MKVKRRTPLNMSALGPAPTPNNDAAPDPAPTSATAAPAANPPRRDEGLGFAKHAYLVAGVAAVVWAGALWAFVAGFQTRYGAFAYTPLQIVALLGISALPATFMLLSAFALRQGAQLAAETRRARTLADEMVLPVALAADHAGGAADSVRREIERIAASAAAARDELLALREVVGVESQGLAASAADVEGSARRLAGAIEQERQQLEGVARALQTQSEDVVQTFGRQGQAVTNAADLAETQLRQAEAALAARTADLTLATADAGAVALKSATDLAEQVERLTSAGQQMTRRMELLRDGLSSERESLTVFAEVLRSDQDDLAARLETGAAQLSEAGAHARASAVELSTASTSAIETLRALSAEVVQEVTVLTETARREQATAEAQAERAVRALSEAADRHYDEVEARTAAGFARMAEAAEAAKLAAAAHLEQTAEAAGAKLEALGQVAFAVSQQADQTFESRLASARELIEQSSGLVEEAGRRSAEQIETGLGSIREMLGRLDTLLSEVDARAAQIPPEAEARIDAVRAAVDRGIGDLTAAARRAAEETQAIDAMFQERVRRNYEVLNEAVQLIGRVTGGVGAPRSAAETPPPPAPSAERQVERPVQQRPVEPPPPRPAPRQPPQPPPPAAATPEPTAEEAGLRPKLRLAPTPDDKAVKKMFAAQVRAATPAPPAARDESGPEGGGDEWTWKDLLSSIEEQPMDDEALDEQLIGEIETLGLDVGALLPRARIDEIAAVLQTGDAAGAREVVRRLAPAAVRRLSRRVLTDKVLRAHADRYVRRYEGLVGASTGGERDRSETAALLSSDAGRAFLLLDAAVGDIH
jgi:hypothetical protein